MLLVAEQRHERSEALARPYALCVLVQPAERRTCFTESLELLDDPTKGREHFDLTPLHVQLAAGTFEQVAEEEEPAVQALERSRERRHRQELVEDASPQLDGPRVVGRC